ncbi:MAG: DNA primase [Candidatus Zambryskibacteria bacterium]|nr:DNA primase [Candidatus Zambryskibacteria bacterium]
MSSSVDQIKSKIDIVSLVSSYIKLEKAGTNFKGRCPFHNEKTPSFFVSPDRGSYYCFGCHAKGDIFSFVQEFEGLDFIGSLKVLADKAGVSLDQYDKGEKSEKQALHQVLEQAVFFYEKNMSENKDALKYLESRGLKAETIKDFRIGLAPAEWRELYQYLLDRGVTEKNMLAVGLIKRKEGTDSFYDTFRGRIMFPINDSTGRVVGFSGRILIPDDKSPKYLNSPETVLFNKSDILFGLDKAKNGIRIKDYSILVEGQMDLVMLHQVGIENTVASSGTALTENHLVKLRRLSNRIIMAYDGDSAGFTASNRSAQIALALGMDLKIAQMPEGKDPADLAREDLEKLKESLRGSKHIIDFYTDSLLLRSIPSRELGQEIKKNVLPYIAILTSQIEKSHFIKSIAQKAFIKEDALWDDLQRVETGFSSPPLRAEESPGLKRVESIERKVMGVIMWQRGKKDKDPNINISEIEEKAKEIFKERMQELESYFEKEKDLLMFEIESYYSNKTDLSKDINYLLLGLEEEYLKKEFSVSMVNLQKAEQSKSTDEIAKYLEECQRISQQINKIKNSYEK